ncbi:MAG: tyrosine-type recombinase/integrase [Clostridia bacterium]
MFNFNEDYVSKGLEKLDLSFELNLKDLRTTFATRCAESGISDIVIAKWLGHSSTYVTKKHYEKVLDEFESAQAQKLSQAFCTTVGSCRT